jgi:hypothetical protein
MPRAFLALGLIGLVGCGSPAPSVAVKAGDKVAVIHAKTKVKVGNDVVDEVDRGMVFVVRAVQGELIDISRGKPGFIAWRSVIPVDQSLDYWSGAIRSKPLHSARSQAPGIGCSRRNG